jgi:hypothetical protein
MNAPPQDHSLLSTEEELFLRITAIVFDNDDMVIGVQATDEFAQDDIGTWTIKAVGLLAHEITA